MSWCDAEVARRRVARGLIGALLLAGLAACGFQPLYGQATGSPVPTVDDLALVRIRPLVDRPGQQLHNLLRDRLNPRGQPTQPLYLLKVSVTEQVQEFGVRVDETATRSNLRLTATYQLLNFTTRGGMTAGVSASINSYNILSNEFATYSAEEDARKRGLREIADDIQARLAIHFFNLRRKTS